MFNIHFSWFKDNLDLLLLKFYEIFVVLDSAIGMDALDGVRYVCVCVCVCYICVLTFDSSTMLTAELFLGLINSKICNYKYLS